MDSPIIYSFEIFMTKFTIKAPFTLIFFFIWLLVIVFNISLLNQQVAQFVNSGTICALLSPEPELELSAICWLQLWPLTCGGEAAWRITNQCKTFLISQSTLHTGDCCTLQLQLQCNSTSAASRSNCCSLSKYSSGLGRIVLHLHCTGLLYIALCIHISYLYCK